MRSEESPPKSAPTPNTNPKPKTEEAEYLGEQRKIRKSVPKREEETVNRTRLTESPPSHTRTQGRVLADASRGKSSRKPVLPELRRPERYPTEPKEGCNCRRTACLKMLCACFSKG